MKGRNWFPPVEIWLSRDAVRQRQVSIVVLTDRRCVLKVGNGTPTEGEYILIGDSAIHTPEKSGCLYCFANDAWKFYGNNRGKVSLVVKRNA